MRFSVTLVVAAALIAFPVSGAVAQTAPVPETNTPTAPATDNNGASSLAPSPAAADPDKIICRDLPPPTGSRLGGRRVCAPKSVWDERAREDQDAISRGQNHGGPGGGSSL